MSRAIVIDTKHSLTDVLVWLERNVGKGSITMTNFIKEAFGIIGLAVFAVVVVIAGPLITIWALDTMFPILNIPMNFQTWLASLVLGSFFSKVKV